MGAWGTAILSNDLSADVAGEYRELIEDGEDAESASNRIIDEYGATTDDPDEATSFWTGLALAQFRLGRLQPRVRERTISIIDAGGDLHLWEESDRAKRAMQLDKLKSHLLGPQKLPRTVRPPKRWPSPVAAGDIFTLPLADGRIGRFRVLAIDESRYGISPIVGMVDEQDRPYKYVRGGGLKDWKPEPMRWAVMSPRRKDLPDPGEVTIVGHQNPPNDTLRANVYTSWANLKSHCLRLLDDPAAQPD
jgi:hypothetical protein